MRKLKKSDDKKHKQKNKQNKKQTEKKKYCTQSDKVNVNKTLKTTFRFLF